MKKEQRQKLRKIHECAVGLKSMLETNRPYNLMINRVLEIEMMAYDLVWNDDEVTD